MKQFAEHGRVGICHSLRKDDLYKRVFSGGYPYLNDGLITRSTSLQPIYSYGKNYEKYDNKFGLFIWTTDDDKNKIENLFELCLENISLEQIEQISDNGSFTYIT